MTGVLMWLTVAAWPWLVCTSGLYEGHDKASARGQLPDQGSATQRRSGPTYPDLLVSGHTCEAGLMMGPELERLKFFYCILKCHLSHFRMFRKLNDGYLINKHCEASSW